MKKVWNVLKIYIRMAPYKHHSFSDLSSEFQFPPSHFFGFFQIRRCVQALFPAFLSLSPSQVWKELFSFDPLQKFSISSFSSQDDSIPVTKSKVAWERELGLNFEDSWWHVALKKVHTQLEPIWVLLKSRYYFRIHYSTTRLSQIYPNINDICDRCQASPCNSSHMFYTFISNKLWGSLLWHNV